MKRVVILFIATFVLMLPTPAHTPVARAAEKVTPLVPRAIMVKWNKVAWCESHGNWHQVHVGPQAFSGALGIKNYVWRANGGLEYGWTAGHATPEEQVIIARRIQASAGFPDYVPDQNGWCQGW